MIPFIKAHACGNDFLVVTEEDAELLGLTATAYTTRAAELARRLCARNTGVGADGVEYLALGEDGRFSIRLFNADGSEAEISGNGTRCVAAVLAWQQELESVAVGTLAGVKRCRVLEREHPGYRIATEMGVPRVAAKTVVLKDGTQVEGMTVSIGNPHFVIFVDSEDFGCFGRSWQRVGEEICTHKDFPQGTNVEFVRLTDTNTIMFRIYERGVGPTQSSGTGTSASAAAAIRVRGVARLLRVISEGGEQWVDWSKEGDSLLLTGPAEIIAQGEFFPV